MENLLLYILEVILKDPECEIESAGVGRINKQKQWFVRLHGNTLFIIDACDVATLRGYINDNPLAIDDDAANTFSWLFTQTIDSSK